MPGHCASPQEWARLYHIFVCWRLKSMSFWGICVPPRPVALIRENLQSLSEATPVDVVGCVPQGADWQIWFESKGASSH
jgi:hypothetical protein